MSFLSKISDKLFGNSGRMKDLQVAAEKRKEDKDKRDKRDEKRKKDNAARPPM